MRRVRCGCTKPVAGVYIAPRAGETTWLIQIGPRKVSNVANNTASWRTALRSNMEEFWPNRLSYLWRDIIIQCTALSLSCERVQVRSQTRPCVIAKEVTHTSSVRNTGGMPFWCGINAAAVIEPYGLHNMRYQCLVCVWEISWSLHSAFCG